MQQCDTSGIVFSRLRSCQQAKALEMATIDGYQALGLDDRVGSIEHGKLADLIVVDLFSPNLWPVGSPVQQLAYFATGRNVRHVFVDGRHVVDEGELVSIDVPALLEEASAELRAAVRGSPSSTAGVVRQTGRLW
ncbi:MAG: amidohydrolase family protein [Acidimicrobiia bacterium]|nr:amidohydrolase family protein [Acidimicrobiia bacterium]